jgi:alpha-galactosidase
LGDWDVNTNKLPQGLGYLATEAKKRGVNFGIWIEPEMVNPASDLYQQHPNWAIQQPQREPILARNQLDLDLSRPEVHDFVWGVVDRTLGTPGVGYTKWDANRFVSQPGSTYLPADGQSEVLIRYNFALYDIMERMAKKYPSVMAMVCSGGGGRVDYGSLKYFHSFWPSDNTDPVSRIKIQWGFGHFFPATTIAAHVTQMGKRPLKFAVDVAMSGALGVDMDVRKLSPEQRKSLASAIALYKECVRDVVEQGDLYRLESPYNETRTALNYVSEDRSKAVLFVYQLNTATDRAVKLRGLDPKRHYRARSLYASAGEMIATGESLTTDGFVTGCTNQFDSAVIELIATD